MLYGAGLPILFPVALAAIFFFYIVEKGMLAWSYKSPPSYDERLNNNVLALLTYAPLLFLAFGYWMFSSKQLLYNNVYSMVHSTDVYTTGHIYTEAFDADSYSANPSMPYLILFWLFLFGVILRGFIFKYVTYVFPILKIGDLEIDEDLDNYFNCIDDVDRNWSIKEEENARSVLNMKILDNETLE